MQRVLFDPQDDEAARAVGSAFLVQDPTRDDVAYASAVMKVLADYGPPRGGNLSQSLATLLTQSSPPNASPSLREAFFWLRWQAADLLDAMATNALETKGRLLRTNPRAKPFDWAGAARGQDVLIGYLERFERSVRAASKPEQLDRIATDQDIDKLVRRAVSLLGGIDSQASRQCLSSLRSVGEEKLRHFAFLAQELEAALQKQPTR